MNAAGFFFRCIIVLNTIMKAVKAVFSVGSDDYKLYAFNASGCGGQLTCTSLWTATTGSNIVSSPAVANGVVYVGSWDHKLYALDANTGSTL
jgi:outer membrane protein assembly factor BamB